MSNITNNRINQTIPQADLTAVGQHVADITTLLPFLIGLTKEEKKELLGINVSNKAFVEDCLTEMNVSPGILPAFVDPAQVQTDFDLFEQLDQIRVGLEDLLDKVKDTQYLAGAEAYNVCLIFYRLAEAAAKAGLPGADERYNRLKERFKAQGSSNTPDSNPTPPSE